ncbi:hypothetical protein LTR69_004403 [Exophiala sideris]|uniref:Uncharacterized protein n=1 Tax=Exophiala sideris TaxID=1016849 RepID=A0ABR0JDK5_9EURO|nr:hypothetical protein LTR69_004403 [Exophiala sideris]
MVVEELVVEELVLEGVVVEEAVVDKLDERVVKGVVLVLEEEEVDKVVDDEIIVEEDGEGLATNEENLVDDIPDEAKVIDEVVEDRKVEVVILRRKEINDEDICDIEGVETYDRLDVLVTNEEEEEEVGDEDLCDDEDDEEDEGFVVVVVDEDKEEEDSDEDICDDEVVEDSVGLDDNTEQVPYDGWQPGVVGGAATPAVLRAARHRGWASITIRATAGVIEADCSSPQWWETTITRVGQTGQWTQQEDSKEW